MGLDIVGMVEPWGAPADLANVVLNLLRNRPEAAAASAGCMLGGGVVGVLIKRGGRLADDIVENAPKSGWPKGIRKQKPYTAAEICARDCVKDAARIRDALGRGEIKRIDTPLGDRGFIGEIRLPNGETIAGDTFRFHEVLFDGERVYDSITGPQGMLLDDYKNMFDQSLVDLLFRHF